MILVSGTSDKCNLFITEHNTQLKEHESHKSKTDILWINLFHNRHNGDEPS